MSDDFTVVRGNTTLEEIRLSRQLARAVEETQRSQTNVPVGILHAYNQLAELYRKQIEAGEQ